MLRDLRIALRSLAASPVFTLSALLCIALGVGANAAVFSVVDAVLLRPLPLQDLDRMVVVREDLTKLGLTDARLDPPTVVELAARRELFADVAAFYRTSCREATFAAAMSSTSAAAPPRASVAGRSSPAMTSTSGEAWITSPDSSLPHCVPSPAMRAASCRYPAATRSGVSPSRSRATVVMTSRPRSCANEESCGYGTYTSAVRG